MSDLPSDPTDQQPLRRSTRKKKPTEITNCKAPQKNEPDFPHVWRPVRKFREGASKKEKDFVRNKRKFFKRIGITSIPDQGGIESDKQSFLMQMKDHFQENVKLAHRAWQKQVDGWKEKGLKPIDVGLEFRAFSDYWRGRGISIIYFSKDVDNNTKPMSNKDYLAQFAEKIKGKNKFEDIDIRYWKVLYSNKTMSPAERTSKREFEHYDGPINSLVGHLRPLATALYTNLQHVLPDQEDGFVPEISEIGFLAWGTADQIIHSDFPVEIEVNGEKDEIHPKDVNHEQWYGSSVYYFEDEMPLCHGPLLIVEPPLDGKLAKGKKSQRLVYTQQKFITFFGPHVLHGGGKNWEMVRLHVHYDPPPNKEDSKTKRLRAQVLPRKGVPIRERGTQGMFKMTKKKNFYNGGIETPHTFDGFYEEGTYTLCNDPREKAMSQVRMERKRMKQEKARSGKAGLKAPPKPPPGGPPSDLQDKFQIASV